MVTEAIALCDGLYRALNHNYKDVQVGKDQNPYQLHKRSVYHFLGELKSLFLKASHSLMSQEKQYHEGMSCKTGALSHSLPSQHIILPTAHDEPKGKEITTNCAGSRNPKLILESQQGGV